MPLAGIHKYYQLLYMTLYRFEVCLPYYYLIVLVLQRGCGSYGKFVHRISQHFGYRTRSCWFSWARQKTCERVEEASEYQYKVQSKSIFSSFFPSVFIALLRLRFPHVSFSVFRYSKNRGGLEAARFLSKLIPMAPKLVSLDASYNLMPSESLRMLCDSLRSAKGDITCWNRFWYAFAFLLLDSCVNYV